MNKTPIDQQLVDNQIKESGIKDLSKAKIREIVDLAKRIEKQSNISFVRMDMGVPSLPTPQIATDAEIEAIKNGITSQYPPVDGIPELKNEASKFIKNFVDIDVSPQGCIPTVGSMHGGCVSFMVVNKLYKEKDTTLFIDPGFPVQKQLHKNVGIKYESFDIFNYREDKLNDKLESYLSKGNISSIIYSNPNNPTWICFSEDELKTIGELANKYDVIIIEDLAYFGMDFRNDISVPGHPPYQPSVAKYTDNFILLISSSKLFSYAGQRVGWLTISDTLFKRRFKNLTNHFNSDQFGNTIIYGSIYSITAGTCHSAQYGLAALLGAINNGKYNIFEDVKIYGERATILKKLFTDNGFSIVYDHDNDEPLADGFYFTISYPGMSGSEIVKQLLYHGISAIPLTNTGSEHTEGVRICVSSINDDKEKILKSRLNLFSSNNN